MILSKRERMIGILTAVVVGGLIVYWYVVEPMISHRAQLQSDVQKRTIELAANTRLVRETKQMKEQLQRMSTEGLNSSMSVAESHVLDLVPNWAQQTGMELTSLKPDRMRQEQHQLQRTTYLATGNGSMGTVSHFLWCVHTASLPMRIVSMEITPHKEGTDDLGLKVSISTLYQSAEPEKPVRPLPVAAREEKP